MSSWRNESAYLARFLSVGALNTLFGFSFIFLLMYFKISPFIANFCGYFLGLTLGFVLSKKFVFRSSGHFNKELLRYLVAFFIGFSLNFIVLWFSIRVFNGNEYFSQLLSAFVYTCSMYLLSRWFVFKG